MSSLLASRKMAGSGNFFVAIADTSGYDEDQNLLSGDLVTAGGALRDLGERTISGEKTLARVRVVGGLDNADRSDAALVVVKDNEGGAVPVVHIGAGTRN